MLLTSRILCGSGVMKSVRILLLGSVLLLSACVPKPAAPPPAEPERRPPAAPAPVPPPPPAAVDWRDLPLTPGDWFYREADTAASFGTREDQPLLTVQCDRSARMIRLVRLGITTGNTMTVRTSTGARNFPLSINAAASPYASATANDRFLDAIVFCRARLCSSFHPGRNQRG
jgi:hypothetical protein